LSIFGEARYGKQPSEDRITLQLVPHR